MRVIPAVDVLGGRVVRLFQGRYDAVTAYGPDPASQVRAWVDEGCDLVHVVDLDGARSGRPSQDLWDQVGTVGASVQLGGGIRSVESARHAGERGIERVMLGTSAVWEPEILADTVSALGPSRVVAAVDVRDGRATGAGWLDEGRPIDQVLGAVLEAGVVVLLVTAVARDGTMEGPDLELLTDVRRHAPGAEVMAAGGVTTIDDLAALADRGIDGAVVGRALYEGRLSLSEALERFPPRAQS